MWAVKYVEIIAGKIYFCIKTLQKAIVINIVI